MFKNKPIYCRVFVDKIVPNEDGSKTIRLVNKEMGLTICFQTEDETISMISQAGVQFKWGKIPWLKQKERDIHE